MAASTSTCISPYAGVYDVFLNHRGPDVKKGFATDLYRRLISHGLQVFLDYQELNKGEKFDSEIKGAIASASVQVAIFSPNYVDSKWCLDELQLMLDSGALVIPVFYGVEPTDLRRTGERDNGVYAVALRNQENKKGDDGQLRYNSTTVQGWRKALSRAAEISGFELKEFNHDEGQLLDGVVECVRKRIRKPLLDVASHPTGLEKKVQDFEREVLSQQQTGRLQVVLIAGLGGVGKTTLAKQLFNSKSVNYSKYYFLSDVRENAILSLNSLQKKLLKGLIHLDVDINNADEGKITLKHYLKDFQVLIVLDDIDHVDQVHALLPLDVLHPNSFILITSRDKNILASLGKEMSSIYELSGLDDHHSRKLFCSYAFCQPHPLSGFESLVERFLKACQGLPLSLKVFGTLVSGNTEKSEWEDQLTKLQQILPNEIQQRLQISYDALDKQEKNIFLDIACFFIGEDRDTAINIWNGSGWSGSVGFRTLQNKCLVELDMENKMRMHDHLRDLGRYLARLPELPRRLWNIDDLKHHSSGITELRGIQVFLSENSYDADLLDKMIRNEDAEAEDEDNDEDEDEDDHEDEEDEDDESSHQSMMLRKRDLRKKLLQLNEVKGTQLQLLDVDFLSEQVLTGVHLPNLRWLRWYECHLPSLPSWIPMEDLRVLEVHGKELKGLWQAKKVPLQLRELRIFAPLDNIPKSIGKLKQLEKLHLVSRYLGRSSGRFSSLKELDIRKLRALKELDIRKLSALKELVIANCSLKSIRGSAELTKLRNVDVSNCFDLEELQGFENLRSLEELLIRHCGELKSIRGSAELRKLRKVYVECCSNLEELPGFENLRSLEELRVINCGKLKSIRGSAELRELRKVYVDGCSDLEELLGFENMRSLEELNVYGCPKLKIIRGSAELRKLPKLTVTNCYGSEELPGFENLSSLKELYVYGCESLKIIRGSAELRELQKIIVENCHDLEELRGFENLSSLEELYVYGCPKLKIIRGSAELRKLRKVTVKNCYGLEELPGFENLSLLEELYVYGCESLKIIRGSAELRELQKVIVENCHDLEELRGFENLRSLKDLDVSGCVKLKSIRGSVELTKLQKVKVRDCSDLEELPGFENLRSLEVFDVSRCVKLESIPPLALWTKLVELNVSGLSYLEELQGVENLRSLKDLDVSGCVKLKRIPGLTQFRKLQKLDVSCCSSLEELPGIEHLNLLWLYTQECPKLRWSEGVVEQLRLQHLFVAEFCNYSIDDSIDRFMTTVEQHLFVAEFCYYSIDDSIDSFMTTVEQWLQYIASWLQ